ncbi:MAG TPA: NAD-dependent epimerase/dehydratase family protein [Vicinamibacterales bacterium]|nr:NAD-dependent epimerase/dehydratase family protein [Vicinamibacterales bacterium]
MKVILFGATGMVGAGTLREALADPDVETVLSVGRRSSGVQHPKLRELLITDLFDVAAVETELVGWDACVWAVGISSIGLDEAAYAKVTEELTLRWARALLRLNPDFSFCYCSAAGADRNTMWARVRRRVESELKAMPFRHVGCVRPGLIQPGPGIRSRVRLYQAAITVLGPLVSSDGKGGAGTGHHVGAPWTRDAACRAGPRRSFHSRVRGHQPHRSLSRGVSDGNHATSTALSDVVMSGRKQAAPANRVDGAGTRVSGDMSAAQRRSVTCGDFGACDAGSRLTRATRRSNGSRPQPVSSRSTCTKRQGNTGGRLAKPGCLRGGAF